MDGDNAYVTRAVPGDDAVAAGLEQAYEAHYRDVYRFVLALTRAPDEAEEITSETFARAVHSWRAVPYPALPWLLLTARRIALDRWRRAKRWARVVANSIVQPQGAGESQTEFWLWFDAVSRALTARQREALLLRYREDLSDAHIGYVMGITESAVRSLISRGLEALRENEEVWR